MKRFWDYFEVSTKDGKHHWTFNYNSKRYRIFTKENNPIPDPVIQNELSDLLTEFNFNKIDNANSSDLVVRNLYTKNFVSYPNEQLKDITSKELVSSIKGLHYLSYLQCDEGHFPNDYGGPMFLLPGLVITSYISKTCSGAKRRKNQGSRRHFSNRTTAGGQSHYSSKSTNVIAIRFVI